MNHYLDWCPGLKAAAGFTLDGGIPNRRLMQVYVLIVIAALGVGVPYLLLFEPTPPPSWIIAERIDSQKSPETFIEIEEQDLLEYPQLAMVIQQAEWSSGPEVWITPSGVWITNLWPPLKMTHEEGREIIAFLGGEYKDTVETYLFKIWFSRNLYTIRIEFSEEGPSTFSIKTR